MGSVAYLVLWVVDCHRREKIMDEFLEVLKQQYNEEDIIKGQALLEDIIDITNDGVAGIIAANLFYALMSDELMAFESEGNVDA